MNRNEATGPALAAMLALALAACTTGLPEDQRVTPLAIAAQDPGLEWGGCPPIFPDGCAIAVLQGDPSQPNADIFLRVPGGETLVAHTHSSAERMILVSGQLRVQYKGAAAVTLTPGQYAFGPAGLAHEASCTSTDACTLFIAFEGPVDAEAFAGTLH